MSSNRLSFDPHSFCAFAIGAQGVSGRGSGRGRIHRDTCRVAKPFRGYHEGFDHGPADRGARPRSCGELAEADRPECGCGFHEHRGSSAKALIRATFVDQRPTQAMSHLDELAERWLYQYLPNHLLAYRHASLAGLRTASQAARERKTPPAPSWKPPGGRRKCCGKGWSCKVDKLKQPTLERSANSPSGRIHRQPANRISKSLRQLQLPQLVELTGLALRCSKAQTKATEKLEVLRSSYRSYWPTLPRSTPSRPREKQIHHFASEQLGISQGSLPRRSKDRHWGHSRPRMCKPGTKSLPCGPAPPSTLSRQPRRQSPVAMSSRRSMMRLG